jgi:hypothetical protein
MGTKVVLVGIGGRCNPVAHAHSIDQGIAMNAFTNAMRRAVSGVSIVTTSGDFGRYGLTVSSMTSVSAEPPILLVCVNRNSIAHDAIAHNHRFAVNVLSARQQNLAASFAGSDLYGPAYDLSGGEWTNHAGPRGRRDAARLCQQGISPPGRPAGGKRHSIRYKNRT